MAGALLGWQRLGCKAQRRYGKHQHSSDEAQWSTVADVHEKTQSTPSLVLGQFAVATPNATLEAFIKRIPLFSLVDGSDLTEVLRLFTPVDLEVGQVLFREGEAGRALWALGEGVEVSVKSTVGAARRSVVVAYAKAGSVVGEMALVDDGPRSGTATVVQGGRAYKIEAQAFHAIRSAYVPAAFKVLRKLCMDLCTRLRQTNERIVPSGAAHIVTPALEEGPSPETELLDLFPPFRGLPSVVKLALARQLRVVKVRGVTPLFAEGEPSDGAYFIIEGEVTVGRNGKTLANLGAGSMFGVVGCIDNGPRSASCVTAGRATLLKMRERDFDQLFASGHRFAFQMVDLVARQLVQHVREANALLPSPGRPPGRASRSKPMKDMLPSDALEGPDEIIELQMEDALPLEVELDLAFPTPTP